MTQPRITVLATGGTIAGKAGSATRHDYRPGQIGIDELLGQVSALGIDSQFRGQQIANIGSEDIGEQIWAQLHRAALAAINDPACNGVIITHGTDTVEETAFLFDQTLPADKPVVMVGAMRPADAVGSDGLRNFANAVQVVSDGDAAGRGVLVVMGDKVFAARDIRKARTASADAFAGYPRDEIGLVRPSKLEWFGAPWRSGEEARFAYPDPWPEVALIYIYAGITADVAARQITGKTRAVIVAGVGEGNMPEAVRDYLAGLAKAGMIVVRASRVEEALVDRAPSDDELGFIAVRALRPAKARILVQLMLASGKADRVAIQAEFDRR
ncbi:asparaginase [Altererythrobacter sp. MF3-039]|uniref:asparaginase n=1 Tax=Altererythrobacter sp. MF3-039 TaxID=3252901 RepID=UPI00390CACEE